MFLLARNIGNYGAFISVLLLIAEARKNYFNYANCNSKIYISF